jgi:hypothetical protein
MTWANASNQYSSDYNGFRPNRTTSKQYTWITPADPKGKSYATLAELQKATGQEAHGIELDYDIFENLAPDDPSPAKRYAVYHSVDLNFRLKPGSKAVDAGVVLPTINDGFTGKAPDLGALEVGQPLPHWGPRWITWPVFYR